MAQVVKDRVLEILMPMYNVILDVEKNGNVIVLKDNIKFAIIKDETIFFVDKHGRFEKVAHKMIDDADHFLQEATKSFWHARSLENEV